MDISDIDPDIVSLVRSYWGAVGAHASWGNTKDRTARTAPARAALEQKFLDQADGDPVRAAHVRKAYYRRLAIQSATARRAKKAAREQARREAVAELIRTGPPPIRSTGPG